MASPSRLTDKDWRGICEAAKLTPDADARTELEVCLFVEYPALAYDPKHVATAYGQALKMLRLCGKLALLYPTIRAFPDNVVRERDLYFIERLRRRAVSLVFACEAMRRANAGRRNVRREWLISRLCGIWLDNFNAEKLTVTVPGAGGSPRGPLVSFLLSAMRLIMPKRNLLSPETLRDAIDREREGRARVRQWALKLKQRGNGGLTREK